MKLNCGWRPTIFTFAQYRTHRLQIAKNGKVNATPGSFPPQRRTTAKSARGSALFYSPHCTPPFFTSHPTPRALPGSSSQLPPRSPSTRRTHHMQDMITKSNSRFTRPFTLTRDPSAIPHQHSTWATLMHGYETANHTRSTSLDHLCSAIQPTLSHSRTTKLQTTAFYSWPFATPTTSSLPTRGLNLHASNW